MSFSPFDVDYHPGLATRSPSFLARKPERLGGQMTKQII